MPLLEPAHRPQGKGGALPGAWARPTCWPWRTSWGQQVAVAHCGVRTRWWTYSGNLHPLELSWRSLLWQQGLTSPWRGYSSGMPQGEQPVRRELGTHQQTGCLRTKEPTAASGHAPRHNPAHQSIMRPSFSHQPLPLGSQPQTLRPASPTRGQTPEVWILPSLPKPVEPASNQWEPTLGPGFPGSSDGEAFACNAGDPGSILGSGISLQKEMATHSSILAWKIPWTEEHGGLHGVTRVRHNLVIKPPTPHRVWLDPAPSWREGSVLLGRAGCFPTEGHFSKVKKHN